MRRLGWLLGAVLLVACEQRLTLGTHDGAGSAATTTTSEGGDPLTGGGGIGGAAPVCTAGACVPSAAGPFVRVTLVSIGKPEEVQPCPSWAPLAFEGFAGMTVEPHSCPSCTCGPAACALPEQIHASAAKCPGEGAASINWDAPPAWEGGCFSDAPIASGLQCSGVPCVQSITIDAPQVEPCKPIEQGAALFPDPVWDLMARECKINVDAAGCGPGESCAPVPPEGFALCVSVAGEGYECPPEYPDPFLVFDSVDNSRACSPCSCSDPAGASCSALVSLFTDGACGAFAGLVSGVERDGQCVYRSTAGCGARKQRSGVHRRQARHLHGKRRRCVRGAAPGGPGDVLLPAARRPGRVGKIDGAHSGFSARRT